MAEGPFQFSACSADNAASFAVLPIREILDDGGFIATLRARGYAIEAPQ